MADRSGVYLHVEFGVSFPRRPSARTHRLTYMSKSARERADNFPRHVPPPSTNFLAISNRQPQHRKQPRPLVAGALPAPTTNVAQHPVAAHGPVQQRRPQAEPIEERQPRSHSSSSHDRGRSAPAPFSDSPWDASPEPIAASALPTQRHRRGLRKSQMSKPLPATPNQFRLGESDMPWSPTPYPIGSFDDTQGNRPTPTRTRTDAADVAMPSRKPVDDRARGRATEMQSLATAMMTIDNGFEDQWWYQGQRMFNIAGDLISPSGMVERFTPDGTVGWAVAGEPQPLEAQAPPWCISPSVTSSMVDIVSPISDFSSPASNFRALNRSLTTRSDELHM